MKRLFWQSQGFIVAIVAGACASEPVAAEIGGGCTISTDCNEPYVCVFSRCHAQCAADRDCGAGQRCVISKDEGAVCQLGDESACAYTSDCPLGQVCAADLQCRTECILDKDCLSDQLCIQHTCASPAELVDGQLPGTAPPEGTPCSYDSECPPMMSCRQARCVFDCLTDLDCQPSWSCIDHVCIEPHPLPPCVPGQTPHCNCADNSDGVMLCLPDFTYGPCMCSPGSGGMGGGGPSSSSNSTGIGGFGGTGPSSSSNSSGIGGFGGLSSSSNSTGIGVGGFGGLSSSSNSTGIGVGGFGGLSSSSNSSGVGVGGFGGLSSSSNSSGVGVGGFGGAMTTTASSTIATGVGGAMTTTASSTIATGVGGAMTTTASSTIATGVGGAMTTTASSTTATGVDGGGLGTADASLETGVSSLDELLADPASPFVGGTYLSSRSLLGAASVTLGVDDSAQVIVSGVLASATDFGDGTLPTDGDDLFLARLDASDLPVRTEALTADGSQTLTALAVDGLGNAVLAGEHAGPSRLDFCGGSSAGAFVAMRSAGGAPLWCKTFSGPSRPITRAAAIDGAGSVVITGSLHEATFGAGTRPPTGAEPVFVTKLDAAGRLVWSRRFGGTLDQAAYGMAVDRDDAIVVVGAFEGRADFGGEPLTSRGGTDVFVVKLSARGDHLWSKRFGGALDQAAAAVSVDDEGNIALAGYFNGTIDFGGEPLVSAGGSDAFVVELDPDGGLRWSRRFGAASMDRATTVATDGSGAVIVGGSFEGAVDEDGLYNRSAGGTDGFVGRLDPSGGWLWRRAFGNAGTQWVQRAAAAPSGVVVIALASSGGALDFGGGPAFGRTFLVELAP